MKRFSLSMVFRIGLAALVGLAIIAPTGESQAATSADGSVIVVEGSALGQSLGNDVATKASSIVTLDTPLGVVPQRSSDGADENQSVQQAGERADTAQRYFITDLGTLGGSQSFAYAVNDAGEVVGQSWLTGDVSSHSFLYSNGKMTDLYPLNSQSLQTVGFWSKNSCGIPVILQ